MSRNYASNQAEKISRSLATAWMAGFENDPEGFENTNQNIQILTASSKLFKADAPSFNVDHIVFESTTVVELDKEQRKLATERRDGPENPVSQERVKNFAQELENMKKNWQENQARETSAADGNVDASRAKIDPISKKPIKVPVKNRRCNHIYDKQVVLEAIRINSHLRCPYLGCTNKRVQPSDLIDDNDMMGEEMEQDATIDIDDD